MTWGPSSSISREWSLWVAASAATSRCGKKHGLQPLKFRLGYRSQFLDREIRVGVDANLAGDAHGLLRNLFRAQLGVLGQRPRRRQRERPARTNGAHPVIGFDHVAVAG